MDLVDVVSVRAIAPTSLHVVFDDGTQGVVDLEPRLAWLGVFAALRDPAAFAQVSVHPELRVVCWASGADLDSEVLREWVLDASAKP